MDDNRVYHIHPHILRRGVDSKREMIFHAPMDIERRRGLLVFVSGEEAAEFARGAGIGVPRAYTRSAGRHREGL
jgi:hypothetical protein